MFTGVHGKHQCPILILHYIQKSNVISLRDEGNFFNCKLALLLANWIYEGPYRVMVQGRKLKRFIEIVVFDTNKPKNSLQTNGVILVTLV
jgi:hypothetical protein